MNKETGGPAFPRSLYTQGGPFNSSSLSQGYGMTLRDYFAAQAMQGFVVNKSTAYYGSMVQHAYEIADLMIKAREQ